MLRAGRDGLGRVEDGVAEVVNSAFVDAGVTVLLLARARHANLSNARWVTEG
jgi:hypothetical protein